LLLAICSPPKTGSPGAKDSEKQLIQAEHPLVQLDFPPDPALSEILSANAGQCYN
jgi:hypothetical protein